MEQNSRKLGLLKLIIRALIYTITTAVIISVYLIYKGKFTDVIYSNWLFNASMVYIALGALSTYGSYMSINSFTHKYNSTVMSANYETRARLDRDVIYTSFKFTIQMVVTGALLFLVSAAADKLI